MEEKEDSSDYLIFHNKMISVISKEPAVTILAPGIKNIINTSRVNNVTSRKPHLLSQSSSRLIRSIP
jgi:hypothetical protein